MRPIPISLRNKLASKKFYQQCAVCGSKGVQWHHSLIHAGRQQNEEFCIVPLCVSCHDKANDREFKQKIDWITWNRASDYQVVYYSKAINYGYERKRLNDKFGGAWVNPVQEE